jgi:hypothetical protein
MNNCSKSSFFCSFLINIMVCFGFLITNIRKQFQKLTFFYYPQHLSFSILSLLFHISFVHLIHPSVFILYFSPVLSLSHLATSIPNVLNYLSLLIAPSSIQYLFSLLSFLHLNLTFLSFALSLSPGTLEFPLP